MPVFLLNGSMDFPPPHLATRDGLLAIGGDLSQQRLLAAYQMGIFPWYSEGQPILWWSPDPRLVLRPAAIRVSRRLERTVAKGDFRVTMDRAFDRVIEHCADIPRPRQNGTWIVRGMIDAYQRLHRSGYAHSVEVWRDERLVGGLYGVSLGRCFFGESMFTLESNASKVALVRLARHLHASDFAMIDCQVATTHLERLGARQVPRTRFLRELEDALGKPTLRGPWALAGLRPGPIRVAYLRSRRNPHLAPEPRGLAVGDPG